MNIGEIVQIFFSYFSSILAQSLCIYLLFHVSFRSSKPVQCPVPDTKPTGEKKQSQSTPVSILCLKMKCRLRVQSHNTSVLLL